MAIVAWASEPSCALTSASIASAVISGTSPARITTVDVGVDVRSPAACTAPPVPLGSGWIATSTPSGSRSSSRRFGLSTTTTFPAPGLLGRGHRPQDQRATAERVQNLRQRGTHARSLAGSDDHDGGRGHRSHRSIEVSAPRWSPIYGEWCKGSTADFDSASSGSNPGSPVRSANAPRERRASAGRVELREEASIARRGRLGWRPHAHSLSLAAAVAALLVPAAPAFAGDPTMPLCAGPGGDAVHRPLGDPGHRRSARSTWTCSTSPPARRRAIGNILIAGVRAGRRRDGHRARASRARRSTARTAAGVQRVIGAISRVGQRVRREGRAGDVDRRDPRHAGRRARQAGRAVGAA